MPRSLTWCSKFKIRFERGLVEKCGWGLSFLTIGGAQGSMKH